MQLSGLCTNCALVMFRVYKCLCANYHNFVRGSNSCLFGPLITKCDITRNSYWIFLFIFVCLLFFPPLFFPLLPFFTQLLLSFFPSLLFSFLFIFVQRKNETRCDCVFHCIFCQGFNISKHNSQKTYVGK